MDAAAFTAARLKSVLPRLQLRCRDLQQAERLAAWQKDYERVAPLHASMVAYFSEVYPKLVAQLARLMHDMVAIGRSCSGRQTARRLDLLARQVTS
jgi:hypothetical protein